jgi:hypothetical protein
MPRLRRYSAALVPDGWIQCSEQMPEPNNFLLVSSGIWVGVRMYSNDEDLDDNERWQDEHREFIDLQHFPVTHEMPLPKAPQQQEEKR